MNAPNRVTRALGIVTLAAIAGASLGSGAAQADRHWHHHGYYHPYYAPPPPVYYAPPAPPPGLGLYFNIR
jgi:hypothetical protein